MALLTYSQSALRHIRLVAEWVLAHDNEIDPRISQIAAMADNDLLFTVGVDWLNIRIGPGITYTAMGHYVKGAQVPVLETYHGWGRVADNRWICIKPIYGVLSIRPHAG